MLHLVKLDRSYGPETIAVMTTALDTVCQSLSARMNGNEDVKLMLAEAILRLVDRGERDPMVIAGAVIDQLTGNQREGSG
jgi:hypothetical protein